MDYKFHYDKENDIFYISSANEKVEESVEFSEDIVLDLTKEGRVIGVELFYASEFLNIFNKEINKEFLMNLSNAGLEYKDFRNVWYIMLILKSGKKEINQVLPPLKKSEYTSPLITSN
ncbi:MAG: DUF2283 domain-containing protein [Nanoarchaeota archaeon]